MSTRGNRQILTVMTGCLLVLLSACGGTDDGSGDSATAADPAGAGTSAPAPAAGSAGQGAGDEPAAGRPVISEVLPYAEVNEELVYGYFVFPADMVEPLPAVVVVHEWWGLNDDLRSMADRVAAQGYIVLAVDLFGGDTATIPAGARDLMLKVVENPEPANENLRQAYNFVRTTAGAPRVASLGWGFGGGWSLNMALLFPDELDAAVIYYGQVTDDEERLQPLDVPVLGIFAENDRGIPVESVREFEEAMGRLRKDYDIRVFPDAGHAFATPGGNNYDAGAAEEAWTLTTAFLAEHLRPGGDGAD